MARRRSTSGAVGTAFQTAASRGNSAAPATRRRGRPPRVTTTDLNMAVAPTNLGGNSSPTLTGGGKS